MQGDFGYFTKIWMDYLKDASVRPEWRTRFL